MERRLELHEELCELLGSRNVYFQPPESLKMQYPCIRYSKSDVYKQNADNRLYQSRNSYEIIVIDSNPDSLLYESILSHFSMCKYDRSYISANLNHDVLTLYY